MQSVGHRCGDKNKDIFEGDFVRIVSAGYDHLDIHIVVKTDLGFVLQGLNHTTKKFGDMKITRYMKFWVIGNVYADDATHKKYWGQVEK